MLQSMVKGCSGASISLVGRRSGAHATSTHSHTCSSTLADLIDGANTTRWEPAIEAKGAENKVADSDLSRKYADWKVARTSTLKSFKKACHEERVLPYFVMKAKQAGCLLTPVLDLTASDAAEGVRRLQAALLKTKF